MDKFSESDRAYINWMYHLPGLGRKRMGVILSQGLSASEIYHIPTAQMQAFLTEKCNFTEKAAQTLAAASESRRKEITPERLMENLYQKKILFLLPGDESFPQKLKDIPDAPFALYMMGDETAAKQVSEMSVAIIGARDCSVYGRYVAEELGRLCARRGIAVVSGMAYGVDGISQWAAAREGASVAAVLGCGVDVCYPPSNRKLYEYLKNNGCIYSEYIPQTEPKPTNFPPRNRIISGMAKALVVVEAKEKSGTLITVDMALEQGKEVYVIPGRINDPMSRGCNRLIRQGASIVYDMNEMLDEMLDGIPQKGLHNAEEAREGDITNKNPYTSGSLRHAIYESLDIHPKSVQQIFESPVWMNAGVEKPAVAVLQTELFYMRMEGEISEENGRFSININL